MFTVALRDVREGWDGNSCTVVGASPSLAPNRQVVDGGAQRLLPRGRRVAAVVEVIAMGLIAAAQPLTIHVGATNAHLNPKHPPTRIH
jgi:hypothetical protein